ncbi:WXG100 family type VII secretion target [Nocardia sp. NPDC052566]|uniref:WXG100 family type VII secretion target n=1 Tax=Nocardia sp. NPDC052566 TaxID=3364330 RepID=UPI0037C7D948
MTDYPIVDFTDLGLSAKFLSGASTDSTALFDSGHSEISTAASGWVGSSATELASALEKMRGRAAHLTGRMDDHSTHMAGGVVEYKGGELDSETDFDRLDPGPGLLNL